MACDVVLEKYADEVLPYEFDFSAWSDLLGSDPIESAVVTDTPDGELTLTAPGINASGTAVSVIISDGVAGTEYTLVCLAQTSSGLVIQGSGALLVL